jgi:hypothetical protein
MTPNIHVADVRPLGLSDDTIQAARSRFYPHWWTHATEAYDTANKPLYQVVVYTKRDACLARASKPEFVHAEIELRSTRDE